MFICVREEGGREGKLERCMQVLVLGSGCMYT